MNIKVASSSMYRNWIKPVLDWIVALVVLLLSLPVMLPAMLALALENRGKVWFVQARPGYCGKLFNIIKFRTMTDTRDGNGELLPDGERLTLAGKWIRKFSLDELPQMINVLRGDMSLVGPRPLLVEYLPKYSEEQKRRHDVKPGITGWAQVNGRNAVSWQEKFSMDCWYVDHQSFWLDARIVFLTIYKVFKLEGISSGTSATMEKFNGNA